MVQSQFQSCIKACYECAEACDTCAAACLRETDPRMMARCIMLDDECAAICWSTMAGSLDPGLARKDPMSDSAMPNRRNPRI